MKLGTVIAEKFRIERVIGRGAMGVVVLATDLATGGPRAMKLILPQFAESETLRGRFIREAQTMTRLKSEHVARVYEAGELADGTLFLAMEFLEGQSLEELVQSGGPLPAADAVDLLLEALDAVAEAHELGLVHRDLKPSNLFLAARPGMRPMLKVLDFGIVKDSDAAAKLTATGTLPGTPAYMAPEQVALDELRIDERVDVWALGVTLYEILTGELPWSGEINVMLTRIRTEAPPRPRARRPDIAKELEAIVLKCLSKRPEDRFRSGRELSDALREVRKGGVVQSDRNPRGAVATVTAPRSDRSLRRNATTDGEEVERRRPGTKSNALLFAAIVISLFVVVGFVLAMQGRLASP